jgi:hypothetical protein
MEINSVDPFTCNGYRFKGTTRMVPKGALEFTWYDVALGLRSGLGAFLATHGWHSTSDPELPEANVAISFCQPRWGARAHGVVAVCHLRAMISTPMYSPLRNVLTPHGAQGRPT